ncbi:hypothetical protein BGZ73_001274 [Actinomortierella ambigua]|nr:hypothetical protein BGZ73_001274 [Actinomortierella ambigua]
MLKYALLATTLAAVSSAYKLLHACNHSNFGGNCLYWYGEINTCYGVGDYNDAISSAEVFEGIHCRLYRDADCQGAGPVITGPAYNLQEQDFNDVTSSFYCYFP